MIGLCIHTRADLLDEALGRAGDGAAEAAAEQRCPAAAAEGAAPLAHRALADLVDEAAAAAAPGGVRLGAVGESLLLSVVTAEARAPLEGLSTMAGLRRALGGIFQAALVAGLSPALFARLLGRLAARGPGASAARLEELGRLYGRYRALLGARLFDGAGAFRRGIYGLAERGALLDGASLLELRGLWLTADLAAPSRHGQLLALLAAATGERDPLSPRSRPPAGEEPRRRLPLRVALPAVDGRPALEGALAPLQETLYRYHDLDVEEVRTPLGAGEAPYRRFLRGLFRPALEAPLLAPGELPAEQLTLAPAPAPPAEARAVARAVRDLLDGGVAPKDVVVVAERPGGRALLRAALARYRVPVCSAPALAHPEEATTIAQAPPVQAVLALYSLLQQGVPREPFIQLLLSRYFRWGRGARPARLARALRESGVRDLRPAAAPAAPDDPGADEPEHRRRLREWSRQEWFERRSARATGPGAGQASPDDGSGEGSVIAAVEGALGHLDTLPALATLPVHATALRRLLERLQLEACACALSPPPPELDDGLALGRDQEAVAKLLQSLTDLEVATARLSLQRGRIPRERFAQLLGHALQRVPLRPRGVPGAAVIVTDLCGAAGRRCAHLFVTGLLDGQLPARSADDPLLPDEERRGLNRLLGHDVFPLSQGSDALSPLWLLAALDGAGAAHLSWPRADDSGRPLLRSPFVDEVLRAAARGEPPAPPLRVVPAGADARCPEELWMRAALDGAAAPGRGAPAEGASMIGAMNSRSLLAALAAREPARAARLAAIIDIERARLRWFSGRLQPGGAAALEALAGPFVGRLGDRELRLRLTERLPGIPGHPLSASALEDYAQCPFRFFVRRVLKAEPATEGGDDLDALAGGRLHHEVLETFFKERLAAGRLPLRGDEDDREALDRGIAQVLEGWPKRERTGHRELFGVRVRRLREDLWRLVTREAARPIGEGLVPGLFEHKFGPLAISSASERDGGLPLHIYGIINRVDLGPGRALVLDYKTGRLDRYEQILRHDLLDTSFQLPLYAAALKAEGSPALGPGPVRVTARYYSLRSGRATSAELDDQQMISFDPEVAAAAPERNVAEVAYRLWRRLRDGDFRVDPRSCEGCGLEAACRVSLVEPVEESVEAPRESERRP